MRRLWVRMTCAAAVTLVGLGAATWLGSLGFVEAGGGAFGVVLIAGVGAQVALVTIAKHDRQLEKKAAAEILDEVYQTPAWWDRQYQALLRATEPPTLPTSAWVGALRPTPPAGPSGNSGVRPTYPAPDAIHPSNGGGTYIAPGGGWHPTPETPYEVAVTNTGGTRATYTTPKEAIAEEMQAILVASRIEVEKLRQADRFYRARADEAERRTNALIASRVRAQDRAGDTLT